MKSDIQQFLEKQLVLYIVQRDIFCPITGAVLDVRTCKWFVDADGDPAVVVAAEAYDAAVSVPSIMTVLAEKGLFPSE